MRRNPKVDSVGREVMAAARASEEEIAAVAASPELYGRVRARIESRRERPRTVFYSMLATRRALGWSVIAVILFIVSLGVALWPRATEEPRVAQPFLPAPTTTAPSEPGEKPGTETAAIPRPKHSVNVARRHRDQPREVVTDFFPLTYAADSSSLEGGHLVRVRVPRSALLSMGLPANLDRAGEPVEADVFIGDDGLARAIRFIQ